MPILTHFNWPESIVQRQCHARQAGSSQSHLPHDELRVTSDVQPLDAQISSGLQASRQTMH